MKEQLITFETAKLAKEKGFDDVRTNHLPYMLEGDGEGCIGASIYCKVYANCCTQSFLQKWLREVHNLYVESYHDLTSDGKSIQYYTSWGFLQQKDIDGNQNVNGWYDEYNNYKTYEEALEVGLQEALKLIK